VCVYNSAHKIALNTTNNLLIGGQALNIRRKYPEIANMYSWTERLKKGDQI
jgi:hypothetical protein